LACRTFTARQARFLVKYAPKGRAAKDGKNIEMDVRIDLAVMLFPKIKDLQNYGQVGSPDLVAQREACLSALPSPVKAHRLAS
jgi:hypothetical protein